MSEHPVRSFILVLHDVAPETWPAYRSFVEQVDGTGKIAMTWLVVPDFHKRNPIESAPGLRRLLQSRLERGDELALHGYYHCDDGPAPRNPRDYFMRRIFTWEGEFYALPQTQALARIEQGIDLFARLGWPLHGFVAPAWLASEGTRCALARLPLTYTSDAGCLYRLPDFSPIRAPGIVWSARSGWRRGLSRACSAWRERQLSTAPVIRLGLHPVDMLHRTSREYWLGLLGRLLADGRVPVTKIAWLNAQASPCGSGATGPSLAGCNSRQSRSAPSKSAPLSGVNSSGS
jgi:predicted deacetylase